MKHYDLDDCEQLARKAAGQVSRRYWRHGTSYDIALSDIHYWLYGDGDREDGNLYNRAKVERWLANTPQQTSRIYWSFVSAAQRPAEKLKAERLGYDPDDVVWYTPQLVQSLLPLALNPDYDGMTTPDKDRMEDLNEKVGKRAPRHAESGDLLAQVMDVRVALAGLREWEDHNLDTTEDGPPSDLAHAISNYLGGPAPYVGRRRTMSNARAQVQTGREYDGE